MFTTMQSARVVKTENYTLDEDNPSVTLDTHGLSARLLSYLGNAAIAGMGDIAADEDSYPLCEGETLDFTGKIKVAYAAALNTEEELDIRVLYYDFI